MDILMTGGLNELVMWQYRSEIKKPKSMRSKKIARVDEIFSKYIRRRDCGFKFGLCISCSAIIQFNTCDCGHYINRRHMALRFDEQNCNAQCRSCNSFDEGNVQGYRRGLIVKIGEKATDLLEIRKHNECHLSEIELDLLFKYFSNKLKDLEKNS
jgi:hypothetical protein